MVNRCLGHIQQWLWPSLCMLCGDRGPKDRDLCAGCFRDLPFLLGGCARCAAPLAGETIPGLVCGQCLRHPPVFQRAVGVFHYSSPIDYLIHQLKFRGSLTAARLLGQLMAARLAQSPGPLPQLLIPVPLHRHRLRERGYNQAVELARPIARALCIPMATCCIRARHTAAQSALLPAERRRNVRGAFQVASSPAAKHVAIIDDVMTTGHTVGELARILRGNGVEHVQVWACARA